MNVITMATIHNELGDRERFQEILNENEGIVIIKFGADWCAPCKSISPYVKEMISKLPSAFTVYDLDVDDNFEIYAYLKSKKMVTGIPVILAYYRGNKSFASNECVIGAVEGDYNTFFTKCIAESISYKT
jgi:thioredoxin 1